jgi:2-polyprenyl-3-methyl-5-hydroxy-6-metoxy-1,4-benzoquinol methylase
VNFTGLRETIYNRLHREDIYCHADYWNKKAQTVDGHAISMWPNNHLNFHYHKEILEVFKTYLGDIQGKKVLDAGCGTGRLSRIFAEWGGEVCGVDFASEAIKKARELSHGDNPYYRVQSIYDLEDVNLFDIAISWGTLALACRNRSDLILAMQKIRQALKPDGSVFILEPIHRGLLHRVLNMDIKQFSEAVIESGFVIRQIVNLHFWPMRLVLAYLRFPGWVTTCGYYFGQWIMNTLSKNRGFGDYKGIHAVVQ